MPVARMLLVLFLGVLAGMPAAVAAQRAPVTPLQVDGFPLAISPDGSSVAGVDRAGERFCVWDIATLEATCDGELPAPVEARSVTWSPDGSAVAFSLGSASRLVDSDIHVFEVTDGALRNLTDDDPAGTGADDVSFLTPGDDPVAIDVFPAWSADGQSLLFARTMWRDAGAPGVTLMTIPRQGGEPEPHTALEDTAPLAVAGPMTWREDGGILLTTRHPDPANASNAVRRIDPDGTVTTLVDGSSDGPIPDPVLASVASDGTAVSAWSRLDFHEGLWAEETPIFFHVDTESGTTTPWREVPGVNLEDGARLLSPPVFGPDGSVAFLWRVRGGEMGISVLDASGAFRPVTTVGYTSGGPTPTNVNGLSPLLQWASEGTLLLVLPTGGTLIPLSPAGETPAVTPAG